jgi:hypothetical protein
MLLVWLHVLYGLSGLHVLLLGCVVNCRRHWLYILWLRCLLDWRLGARLVVLFQGNGLAIVLGILGRYLRLGGCVCGGGRSMFVQMNDENDGREYPEHKLHSSENSARGKGAIVGRISCPLISTGQGVQVPLVRAVVRIVIPAVPIRAPGSGPNLRKVGDKT